MAKLKRSPQEVVVLNQHSQDQLHAHTLNDTKRAFLFAVEAAKKHGLTVEANFNSTQGEILPLKVYRRIF